MQRQLDQDLQHLLGAFDAMRQRACTNMRAVHLLDGAGHWVQQEQPAAVSRLLLEFMS